ncbi:MAG: helix-turn-helix domain-containing protein [Porphyromonadaceae bacterium]|nr:helix-turn-helix domain-containing protein [Porphyromonadaceae bacterium]
MSVAEKIKQLRNMANIGQCELAEKVGVSQSFISQIENGARCGLPDTMQDIANVLGCSYEELTGEPKFIVQFIRNCKRLSQPQLFAVNEIVLQLIGSGSPAVNQGDGANNIQQTLC